MKSIVTTLFFLLIISQSHATECDSIKEYLSEMNNIECDILYNTATFQGTNSTEGKVYITRPKFRFDLEDQHMVSDGDHIYSWFSGSESGSCYANYLGVFFSDSIVEELSDTYDFECSTRDGNFVIEASSKEDEQIITLKLVFEMKTKQPLLIEWITISNQVTIIDFKNVKKIKSEKTIFDIPEEIYFEGDFQ